MEETIGSSELFWLSYKTTLHITRKTLTSYLCKCKRDISHGKDKGKGKGKAIPLQALTGQ
jgi:hypothetical protein